MIPYDTGKVKIGLAYEKYQRYIPTDDMARLQRAFLSHKREKALDIGLAVTLGIAFGLFLVFAI